MLVEDPVGRVDHALTIVGMHHRQVRLVTGRVLLSGQAVDAIQLVRPHRGGPADVPLPCAEVGDALRIHHELFAPAQPTAFVNRRGPSGPRLFVAEDHPPVIVGHEDLRRVRLKRPGQHVESGWGLLLIHRRHDATGSTREHVSVEGARSRHAHGCRDAARKNQLGGVATLVGGRNTAVRTRRLTCAAR